MQSKQKTTQTGDRSRNGRYNSRKGREGEGTYGRSMKISSSFWKRGVPRPVTGSQPAAAWNPGVPQPYRHELHQPIVLPLHAHDEWGGREGVRAPTGLDPTSMSLKASGCSYRTGLTKPTVPLPALRRAPLMSVRIAATADPQRA